MLEQYDELVRKASERYGVPQLVIKTTIQTESSGNPKAYAKDRKKDGTFVESFGLGQFLLSTATTLGYTGTKEGLYDPATNIDLIAKYWARIRLTVGDNLKRGYSMYNSGSPDLYLSSTQVAQHVQNFMKNLGNVATSDPFILNLGIAGGLLVASLLWYWSNAKD